MNISIVNEDELPDDVREKFVAYLEKLSNEELDEEVRTYLNSFLSDNNTLDASEIYQLRLVRDSFENYSDRMSQETSKGEVDLLDEFGQTRESDSDMTSAIEAPEGIVEPSPSNPSPADTGSAIPFNDDDDQGERHSAPDEAAREDQQGAVQDEGELNPPKQESQGQQGGGSMEATLGARAAQGAVDVITTLGKAGGMGALAGSQKVADILQKHREKGLTGEGRGLFSVDAREELTGKKIDPSIVEMDQQLRSKIAGQNQNVVSERLSEMQASRLSLHRNTISDIIEDFNSARVGERELAKGVTVTQALSLVDSDDPTTRSMSEALLQNGLEGVDISDALETNAREYKRLGNQLQFLEREVDTQGWDSETIRSQVIDPVESWLDDQKADDKKLGALADLEDSEIDLESLQKAIEETVESIRQSLGRLFNRGGEQDHSQTIG